MARGKTYAESVKGKKQCAGVVRWICGDCFTAPAHAHQRLVHLSAFVVARCDHCGRPKMRTWKVSTECVECNLWWAKPAGGVDPRTVGAWPELRDDDAGEPVEK